MIWVPLLSLRVLLGFYELFDEGSIGVPRLLAV